MGSKKKLECFAVYYFIINILKFSWNNYVCIIIPVFFYISLNTHCILLQSFAQFRVTGCYVVEARGGGGYSHTLPIRVCAAQRGRDFEAPDLERGIHFRGVF